MQRDLLYSRQDEMQTHAEGHPDQSRLAQTLLTVNNSD